MHRRDFFLTLSIAAMWPLATQAQQQAKKIPRVAYLESKTPTPTVDGLLNGLRELGYVNDQNIILLKVEFAGPTVREMKEASWLRFQTATSLLYRELSAELPHNRRRVTSP